jgi:hypothetical protein
LRLASTAGVDRLLLLLQRLHALGDDLSEQFQRQRVFQMPVRLPALDGVLRLALQRHARPQREEHGPRDQRHLRLGQHALERRVVVPQLVRAELAHRRQHLRLARRGLQTDEPRHAAQLQVEGRPSRPRTAAPSAAGRPCDPALAG